MKYYAIGTPIGILNDDNERYFIRSGKLLSMGRRQYNVWIKFLHGEETSTVYNKIQAEFSINDYSLVLNSLIDTEMLVAEQALISSVCGKNGIGVGFNPNTSKCTILLDKPFEVTYPAYLFWTYTDAVSSAADIATRISIETGTPFQSKHTLNAIIELLKSGLIQLVD